MPPQALHDYTKFNFEKPKYDIQEIRKVNPQRHEFEQLSGIVLADPDTLAIIGFRDITNDEFWVQGHMPGYPLMPGVLLCEAAAQVAGFLCRKFDILKAGDYVGFGGMDKVRFRAPVYPPCRLVIVCQGGRVKEKVRAEFEFQAFADDRLVANGNLFGVPINRSQSVSRTK